MNNEKKDVEVLAEFTCPFCKQKTRHNFTMKWEVDVCGYSWLWYKKGNPMNKCEHFDCINYCSLGATANFVINDCESVDAKIVSRI